MKISLRLFGHRLLVSSFPSTTTLPTSARVLHALFPKPHMCSSSSIYIGRREFEKDAPVNSSIPVRAFFLSTSVDLTSLVYQNMCNFVHPSNFIRPSSTMANYVVLRFGNLKPVPNGSHSSLAGNDFCYMLVFQYGSIVLFNIHDHEVDGYLKIIQGHASGLLPEMKKDAYEVREDPYLNTWMEGGLDYITLQCLDIDRIRTIGSVLGQSIALDYYVGQVDGMLAELVDISGEVAKSGNFTMERKKLRQLVGKAKSNHIGIFLMLRLLERERSEIALENAKCAQIWEYLIDEFNLKQRFTSLEVKWQIVERHVLFYVEILQKRKSKFLGGMIIFLMCVFVVLKALH